MEKISNQKLGIIAGTGFVVGSLISLITSVLTTVAFASDIPPVTLVTSIITSLLGLIISIAVAKNIRNPRETKSRTLLILMLFVNIPSFLLTAVNVLPRFFRYREKVNKFWFAPAVIAALVYAYNLFILKGFNILNIVMMVISIVAILCFCKWIISNPYNVSVDENVQYEKLQFKNLRITIIIILIVLAIVAIASGGSGSSKSSGSGSSGNKGGFIGSDGEYHAYVPEFGDDVNNWVENNW